MPDGEDLSIGKAQIPELEFIKLLHAEYLKCYDITEDYERRCLTIKSWLGLGLSGALAFGSLSPSAVNFYPVLLTIIAVATSVWLLEALWRTMQWKHVARIDTIEAYMRGSDVPVHLAQVEKSWRDARINWAVFVPLLRRTGWGSTIWPDPRPSGFFNSLGRGAVALLLPYVFLPYAPIIGFAAYQLAQTPERSATPASSETVLRCSSSGDAAAPSYSCAFIPAAKP